MLIGEKYEILQSSAGMMIPFKYLVALCALLLVGWSPAFAAGADDTATEASSTTTPKSHHKKHHATKTAATDTNSITAPATGDVTEKSATATTSTKNTKNTTTTASTGSNNASDTTTSTTPATTSTGKGHKKKGHGSSTAASTNVPTGNVTGVGQAATATSGAKTPTATDKTSTAKATASPAAAATNLGTPGAGGVAAAAATAVSGQAATTTTGKGKHRKHGAAIPQPPIVVNPAAVTPISPGTGPVATTHLSDPAASSSDAPKIETVLPVPRPGAGTTASLPLAMVRAPAPQLKTPFAFNDFTTPRRTTSYPWKNSIVTTVFWIGEGSTPLSAMTNLKSAWDGDWVHNNGGADDQYDMSGYGSGSHASTLNPFYIALPFNDLAYPDKSSRWLPDSWPRGQRRGNKLVSSCQHRWIEIKNRAGRVCFAQWEDVGPIVTDDAEYVFGSSRPSASRGLDVSPAVAKYLGIDSTAMTSWRFVDDADVLPGMWLRYDEQALLFRAMKEKMRGGGANTRIQQLEEPTPEDDDNDSNQKKVGAARG